MSEFEFEWREVAVTLVVLIVIVFLPVNAWETVQRFAGLEPRPDGVSVASHFFGLAFGVLWFGWRLWQHGVFAEDREHLETGSGGVRK